MFRILIADDEALIRKVISRELESSGFITDTAADGKEALDKILKNTYELVILDNQMPHMKGMEVLRQARQKNRNTKVIMLTAFGTIDNAVEAMKLGAYDYATKPFENDVLLEKVRSALEPSGAGQEKRLLEVSGLIWRDPAFEKILETISQIRNIGSTVLITGESGTGKGVVARHIHDTGLCAGKPFIHVNCAVLPASLIDSELFGHTAGAFTGASREKPGKFEIAGDGTIFLDEIATLTPDLQAKLLTVLQERTFEKLGSNKQQKLRARIITATNENLHELVQSGEFRKDLYYRLNVVSIHCPPLRQRRMDIEPLARSFLERYNKQYQRHISIALPETWGLMMEYNWPGNVRELENFIERIVAMNITDESAVQEILNSFVQLDIGGAAEVREPEIKPYHTSTLLEEHEYNAIVSALAKHSGHREKTAQELGISRRTLQYKLKKYKLF